MCEPEWEIETIEKYESKFRKYQKKHPRETLGALNNLDTYLGTLNDGVNPINIKAGFIHREFKGIIAIDQKGGGTGLKETRLYLYPSEEEKVLYLLTIGDKKTQKADLADCRIFLNNLRREEDEKEV